MCETQVAATEGVWCHLVGGGHSRRQFFYTLKCRDADQAFQ